MRHQGHEGIGPVLARASRRVDQFFEPRFGGAKGRGLKLRGSAWPGERHIIEKGHPAARGLKPREIADEGGFATS